MKFALKVPGRAAKRTEPDAKPVADAGQDDASGEVEKRGLGRFMDRKRALRVVALLTVAWVAGQLMQSLQHDRIPQSTTSALVALEGPAPTAVIQVSGEGNDSTVGMVEAEQARTLVTFAAVEPAAAAETLAAQFDASEIQPAPAGLAAAPAPTAPAASSAAEPLVQLADATPALPPEVTAPRIEALPAAQACPVTLDLAVMPGALLGVTLIAPCAPNARVVLQHEGLSITGVTTVTGALFASLPALSTTAGVKATLPGGQSVSAAIDVPQAADFRRFAVQWQGDDAFQVNAYENGAAFGQPGHVSQTQPSVASDAGGFVQVIGDPASAMPLLAQVYTYPLAAAPVEVVVESAVTAKTCGRELIGETLFAKGGRVVVTDLTLAMPDCDAIGDFLVLNNLVPDVTLATN